MIEKIKHIGNSQKLIEILFISMFLSILFGSHILTFSIGFMTIYPFVVLVGILSLLGVFHLKKIKSKIEKFFLLFLFFWLIYALVFSLKAEGVQDAIIDIRSLIMMSLVSWVVIWIKGFLGLKKWKSSFMFSFQSIYFLLLFFAIFENALGIHFIGEFTNKIDESFLNTSFAYSPVYLFDNPNNLVVYLLLTSTIVMLTKENLTKHPFLVLFFIISNLLISVFADSRFGVFVSITMLLFFIILYYNSIKYWLLNSSEKKYYIIIVISALVFTFISKEKAFYGPLWNKKESEILAKKGIAKKKNNGFFAKVWNYPIPLTEIQYHSEDTLIKYYDSKKVRIALILNGISTLENNNYLGLGPGQYRYLHKQKKQKFYTKTIISPHFWLIEIVSQFGVFILIIYLLFIVWILYLAIRFYKNNSFLNGIILISIFVFFFASIMPSSFLILDINWIFLAVLIGLVSENKKQVS